MKSFAEKSRFHTYRSKYQPKVPKILDEICLTSKTAQAQVLPQIAQIFPNIKKKGVKSVSFEKGQTKDNVINALRIGCVLSGGQAAGGHNVIVGLYDYIKKRNKSSQLFGFLGGPKGIFTGKYTELNDEIIDYFKNRGGFDMICSGRDKIQKPQQFQMSLKHCESLKLDGLVVIGGDDSNTNAALLAQYFLSKGSSIRVIGCPKTIDGDLKNQFVEVSFGFDTACKTYSECIGSIMADTLSSKKYYHFIRLMGRSASHIALECALLTRPNYTFIGQQVENKNQTLKQLVQKLVEIIVKRSKDNRNYGVILIPQGLIQFIPEINKLISEINKLMVEIKASEVDQIREIILTKLSDNAKKTFEFLPRDISDQLLLDRDPHGNVQVAKIETQKLIINLVQRELNKCEGFQIKNFNPLTNYFGYEGRCAFPTNFDCDYCYSLGLNAAAIIQSGETGLMSCIRNLSAGSPEQWTAGGYPLVTMMNIQHRKGKDVPVIKKALVELDGPLFKLYQSERQKWALGDYFSMIGPIQFQFQSPLPYLAVPPKAQQLYPSQNSANLQKTKQCFTTLQKYNFNSLTYQLTQQDQEYPEILRENDLRLAFSQALKFSSRQISRAVSKQYEFLCNNQSRLITFARQSYHKNQKHEPMQIKQKNEHKIKRIGISFNGRQFPGAHNLIKGLLNQEVELFGFLGGNKGIFNQKYVAVTQQVAESFINQSGFYMLGRNSDKLRTKEQQQKTLQCCKTLNLDGIILVGASHTMTDAAMLANYFIEHNCQTRVIGIPASIDNNIAHQKLEVCVGFATSSHMYSTLISNLMIDASSNTKYWYFIRLMGRDPSHLALECALSTHPNYAVISEEIQNKGWDLQQIADDIVRVVIRRQEQGLGFGCVIIPEGLPHYVESLRRIKTELDQIKSQDENVLKQKMSQWAYQKYKNLPDFIKTQFTKRDNSGALAYSQIQTERLIAQIVSKKLKELKKQQAYKGSFSPVCHFFGYQGRCALPSRFDQNLARTYGQISRILISQGITGYCPSVRGLQRQARQWFPIAIPLARMLSVKQRSQFGINKAIVDSADVSLKSASFRYFIQNRGKWELTDHYSSPGPIQFYGENKNYIPLTLSLQQKYDFRMIEQIEANLNKLKSMSKFGAQGSQLKIINGSLNNLLQTLQIMNDEQ